MRIHHIAFRTRRLDDLERFYVDVLGFVVTSRRGTASVWLDAGGAILMLEESLASEPAYPAGSMEIVTFAIEATKHAFYIRRLAEAAVTVEDRTPFTIYLRDPDGRRVGLSSYPAELESLGVA